MEPMSIAPTEPRIRFLAAVSLGDVEQRFTKDKYPYWVMVDRSSMRVTRCDSMITRLIDAGWISKHADYINMTPTGHSMLKEHGAEHLRKLRAKRPS